MAVTQISRIQHRRGLEQDLPQLSSAELGWSVDTRKLYIGNGTLEEGAPTTGVTRILTEYDAATLAFLSGSYTFTGNAAGYTAQTGTSIINPITRSVAQKLDDFVNVRDFGAVGDGVTDDTAALTRAIQQIYKNPTALTETRARRTIYFPGGTYLIKSTLLIPPFARLVGDGTNSSIIKQDFATWVANVCDSSFQTGSNLGLSSATLPRDIEISGLRFFNSNVSNNRSLLNFDSAANIRITNSSIIGNSSPGLYPNLVSITSTVSGSQNIIFDNVQFLNGGNAVSLVGTNISSVKVVNSIFDNLSNVAVNLGSSQGFSSVNNYFGNAAGYIIANGQNDNFAVGDHYHGNNDFYYSGFYLGNLMISPSRIFTINSTPQVVGTLLPNLSLSVHYEIYSGTNNSNRRFGWFMFMGNTTSTTYHDDYIETPTGVNANLFANNDSLVASVSSGSATMKYIFSRFD